MKKEWEKPEKENILNRVSLSAIMTALVVAIVFFATFLALLIFVELFQRSMEQNAIISSEQAIVQVQNTITNYTEDIQEVMNMIEDNITKDEMPRNEYFRNLLEIRSDIVAITIYNENGDMERCWTEGYKLKDKIMKNLSFVSFEREDGKLNISSPHVESLFVNNYPWVVTISQILQDGQGENIRIAMDIRFSSIANYVDEVGIGQHGYCFIMDEAGNIIYHPQQQLIYSGLKNEDTKEIMEDEDGSYIKSNMIYTIHTLENSDWRIVGISFVDEMVSTRVQNMIRIVLALVVLVLFTAATCGILFSRLITMPAKRLSEAMGEFETNTEDFDFQPVNGTVEIVALSDSFAHMVVQIQNLMEQVREEELSLRKTELSALQAQINPHFLYNTLDSIAWMCEEERNKEAVEMVTALARLFRISISRGHELITLEKELQHAQSYLNIQKFRYEDQFTYDFDVDEECLQYYCNKITLQPIIENAIYHGLDPSEEGHIQIGIHDKGDAILLCVEDNGVGMTEEECAEILNREAGDRTGIGIKNVNDRIHIYFGKKYGLRITSVLDAGTRVEIWIPKILEGEYESK